MDYILPQDTLARILIIEDEIETANVLRRVLNELQSRKRVYRFDVRIVSDPIVALQEIKNRAIDIVIVDLGLKSGQRDLPDPSVGQNLIARILQFPEVAIIVYSKEDRTRFADELMDLGIDDYIEKWEGAEAAVQKVSAVWRRIISVRNSTIERLSARGRRFKIGVWLFTIGEQILATGRGEIVQLGVTEHEFLRCLVLSRTKSISADEFSVFILKREEINPERMLQNLKQRLRKKLGPSFDLEYTKGGVYHLNNCVEL